ncbi:MAG: 30S ribosomal protein S3 [archaeon]|nr:30S ribosomal protein S3 [Candidatus Bathyarchaeum sp.]
MSVVKHFIEDSIKKIEIEEFLQNEFERAGYGGVSITKTPLGTHLVIYTMRPGLVIGRGGETIRALAQILEQQFQLPSPQISVAEIEVPELNAHVVASRIASALKRGIHYRRSAFWAITNAMEAGALGIEIIISGKLRTDRARYEKFVEGYLPKSGEPPRRYMRSAELHVHLKPGTLGVKVSLLPPDAVFPDKLEVYDIPEEREAKPEPIQEEAVAETPVEPETAPAEEAEPAPEAEVGETPVEVPEVPETVVAEEKPAEVSAPEPEVVDAKKETEVEVESAKEPETENAPEVEAKPAEEKKPMEEEKASEVEVPVEVEKTSEDKVAEAESAPEEKDEAGE